ncbi:hypothetical protein BDZ85DRAFT_256773 [Elsinoe ampelina]|uniref:Uncharacterized protein n=1 Tax=Elsinoe ampelina TaxID=302913 RepID=A0A6A6GM35_9PEZI|nr:hypothetical protein BDZ85DRAFT_256773 [Elsinoe ampelina]
MLSRFKSSRSPASDTDGSEDVFLDLAEEPELSKSDDDIQEPASRLSHNRNRNLDEDDHTLKNLPGQFPDRTPLAREDSRPRSSGQLPTVRGQDGGHSRAQHTRHVSQPNGGIGYSSNLSSVRYNREIASRADHTPSSRYEQPLTSFSQIETPRLRRQRRLYADTDGHAEERPSYMNGYGSGRRSSLKPVSPEQPPLTTGLGQVAPNDSDSVGSQTAASTVWDELDELKSRIKKLEVTGHRLPSTANAAIASATAARPQTATTAPTTVSSSPQQVRKQIVPPSEMTMGTTIPAEVHPTLQSALARARTTLKPQVYRPLEAAVMDSLAMATATGRHVATAMNTSAASTVNGFGTSDRQMRRKVDSLCRNLADLCIAMCDSRSDEAQLLNSPVSARKPNPESSRAYIRQSVELDEDPADVPTAPQSRRASRTSWARADEVRTPRLSISGRNDLPADLRQGERSPSTTPKDYTARYSSLGSQDAQRQSRRPSIAERTEDPSLRAPSRAMTEVGRLGFGVKRDHLRTGAARSPSLRETVEARRRSANMQNEEINDNQSAVSISGQTPSARKFLERVRGTPSEVGSSISGTRPRLGSQDYQTPSPRMTTPSARTSSLNQRRFAT